MQYLSNADSYPPPLVVRDATDDGAESGWYTSVDIVYEVESLRYASSSLSFGGPPSPNITTIFLADLADQRPYAIACCCAALSPFLLLAAVTFGTFLCSRPAQPRDRPPIVMVDPEVAREDGTFPIVVVADRLPPPSDKSERGDATPNRKPDNASV